MLSEIEFTDSLNDNNSGTLDNIKQISIFFLFNTDAASLCSNNSNELSTDSLEPQQQSSPGVSTGSTTAMSPDMLDNIENYLITTEINESGKNSRRIRLNLLWLLFEVCVVRRVKNMQSM